MSPVMKRLHGSSRGLTARDLDQGAMGTTVTVTLFDAEAWESTSKMWSSKYGHGVRDESLASFLSSFARLPQSEAESLAEELLGKRLEEWSSRGGPEHARVIERLTWLVVVSLAVGAVLAAVGLLAIVRFLFA
jgi:hypothetical protein